MANSKESNLLNYLNKEVTNTKGFIKRVSNQINLITELDDMSIEMYDKGQNLLNEIESYTFRLLWLQTQIKELENLEISK